MSLREDRTPRLRIGELARRVEVRPETLRAWERRYDLLSPARSPGGYRLYSSADEALLRAMVAWIDRGVAAAEAARLAKRDAGASAGVEEVGDPQLASTASELMSRIAAFDDEGANSVLDRALGRFSLDGALSGLILPVLAELGEGWERGEIDVGQEHFGTELIRGRLVGLARGWGTGAGPLAVLACPPGERHDLGLVCFGLALRARGWRIAFLGADTPMSTLAHAAVRVHPDAIVLAALEPGRFAAVSRELAALAHAHRVLIAGTGASDELARAAGAEHLAAPPVGAAEILASGSAGRSAVRSVQPRGGE